MLAVWGVLDRLSPGRTAREFAAYAAIEPVWVAGGHSWMLARPGTQAEVLRSRAAGRRFLADVTRRITPTGG